MLLNARIRLFGVYLTVILACFLLYALAWRGPSTAIEWDYFSDLSSYRRRLATIRPSDNFRHSTRLGVFSSVYVINLPRRHDRRDRMEKLARALDVDLDYWSATEADSDLVTAVMERRRIRIERETDAGMNTPKGNNRTTSLIRTRNVIWPADVLENQDDPLENALGLEHADLWTLPASDPRSAAALDPIPAPPNPETRPAVPCASPDDGISPYLSPEDIAKLPAWRILSRGMVACWHSHLTVLRQAAEEDDKGVLILEDDVDIEWDIEARLHRMWRALPADWDIVFLGHCWSAETTYPPLTAGLALHPSFKPKCNHAYAVSKRGARRLVRHLRSPAFAYSRALDQAYVYLIQHKRLNAFSVFPSVVVQTKDIPSDIFPGNGSSWKDYLADSTLERIRLLEDGEAT